MIIELHILQNFAPSCLNRDDTGAPKDCEFGGYRRARISSQCIKRAIRDYIREQHLIDPENLATRSTPSRFIQDRLVSQLVEVYGWDRAEATQAAELTMACLKKEDKNGQGVKGSVARGGQKEVLLFLGEKELAALVRAIHENRDRIIGIGNKLSDELRKKLVDCLDGGKAVDLWLFGRMIADLPEKNVDAACQVAHAISTNKVNVEFDYFTAVDELRPESEPGAGMLGYLEFNSACYYRYANVDLGQLKKLGDEQLERQAWQAFITAAVMATPTGRQTTFCAQNPPDFVFAVAREHGAWSLANAFIRPISPQGGDILQQSALALLAYWKRLTAAYGDTGIVAKPVLSLVDVDIEGLEKVANLSELVARLDEAVNKTQRR